MVVRNFMRLLKAKWDERKFVCVGLDSDAAKLPILHLGLKEPKERLLAAQEAYRRAQQAKPGSKDACLKVWQQKLLAKAQLAFNKRIIDATKDTVCAYKPNAAFYEALGDAGWKTLIRTIEYINKVAPDVGLRLSPTPLRCTHTSVSRRCGPSWTRRTRV
jgi:orotidine-5'-phosphate decarboxylase